MICQNKISQFLSQSYDFEGKISHDLWLGKIGSIRELTFDTFEVVTCGKEDNVICSIWYLYL